jgi:nitroreductase
MDTNSKRKTQLDLLASLLNRRSVRKFLPEPVPLEVIRELIRYGTHAPSACNFQAWRFIIVTEGSTRDQLIDAGGGQLMRSSPVGILVLYDNQTRNISYRDDIQSAAACVQNILTAAQVMGLGACWICSLPAPSYVRRLLHIPGQFSPVAYVAVGYTTGSPPREVSRRHSLDEIIGINCFPAAQPDKGKSVLALWLERIMIIIYMRLPMVIKKRVLNRIVDSRFTKKFEN